MKNGTYIVEVERYNENRELEAVTLDVLYHENGFWEKPTGGSCTILVETAKFLTDKDLRGEL